MRISDVITRLAGIHAQHGDLEVQYLDRDYDFDSLEENEFCVRQDETNKFLVIGLIDYNQNIADVQAVQRVLQDGFPTLDAWPATILPERPLIIKDVNSQDKT